MYDVFDKSYLNYIASLSPDERKETLEIQLKSLDVGMDSFKLYAELEGRDSNKLIGDID